MRFAFEAVDADGRREHGELAAADERAALKGAGGPRVDCPQSGAQGGCAGG